MQKIENIGLRNRNANKTDKLSVIPERPRNYAFCKVIVSVLLRMSGNRSPITLEIPILRTD